MALLDMFRSLRLDYEALLGFNDFVSDLLSQ